MLRDYILYSSGAFWRCAAEADIAGIILQREDLR